MPVVVALKSRTIPAAEAVAQSLRRARAGCKRPARGSSSSSTARPSIRPTRAISARSPMRCCERSAPSFTIACPAFPENGRTIYQGHLFVGDVAALRVRHAPPSADADDRRQPGARAAAGRRRARSVWCRMRRSSRGAAAIRERFDAAARGWRHATPSSTRSRIAICWTSARPAPTCRWSPAAPASPSACRRISAARGLLRRRGGADALPAVGGRAAVVLGQLLGGDARPGRRRWRARHPAFAVDPLATRRRAKTSLARARLGARAARRRARC